jgi:hypothetical protein
MVMNMRPEQIDLLEEILLWTKLPALRPRLQRLLDKKTRAHRVK